MQIQNVFYHAIILWKLISPLTALKREDIFCHGNAGRVIHNFFSLEKTSNAM